MTNGSLDPNQAPEANAGEDQELPYRGEPVEVTLDGSGSIDDNGTVTAYIWRSGDLADEDDGGVALGGPDPEDVMQPEVTLDPGQWTFSLWVMDDDGAVSVPDTVMIAVGEVEAPACVPEDCPMPALGEPCCTSDDTGAEPGDPRGRGPGLCGTDLGAVVSSLAGTCVQIDQPRGEDGSCPEAMTASGTEPGCCTDEGLCGSVNTSAGLGCRYQQSGPGDVCSP